MEKTVPQKPTYDVNVPLNSFPVIVLDARANATENRSSKAVLRKPLLNTYTYTEDAASTILNRLVSIASYEDKHGILTDTADVNVQYRVHPVYIQKVLFCDNTSLEAFERKLQGHASADSTVILPIIPFPSEEYNQARAVANDKKTAKLADNIAAKIETTIEEYAIKISSNERSQEENAVDEQSSAAASSRRLSGEAAKTK